jgi:hypothetical protein
MFYVKFFKSAIKLFDVSVYVSGRYVIVMTVSSRAPTDDDLPTVRLLIIHQSAGRTALPGGSDTPADSEESLSHLAQHTSGCSKTEI